MLNENKTKQKRQKIFQIITYYWYYFQIEIYFFFQDLKIYDATKTKTTKKK